VLAAGKRSFQLPTLPAASEWLWCRTCLGRGRERGEASRARSATAMTENLFDRCANYRFGNEGQNRLLATELTLSQPICLKRDAKGKSTQVVGRENSIMFVFSMMAHQAYACATLWTCGAEMSLAMCKCINSSMEAYLEALEGSYGTVKATGSFTPPPGFGRSADVIPFPIHKTVSSRPR
jgi:hypothetical protein